MLTMEDVNDVFLLEVMLKAVINKVALGEMAPQLAVGVIIESYDRRKQKHTEDGSGGAVAQELRRVTSSRGVAKGR